MGAAKVSGDALCASSAGSIEACVSQAIQLMATTNIASAIADFFKNQLTETGFKVSCGSPAARAFVVIDAPYRAPRLDWIQLPPAEWLRQINGAT